MPFSGQGKDGLKLRALSGPCAVLDHLDPETLPLQPQFRAPKHLFGDSLLSKLCLLAPCLVALETGSSADKGGSWVLLPPGPVDEDF